MFRMTVADVFFIKGRGVAATGRVEEGSVRVGDEVRVNDEFVAKVDAIEAFRKKLDQASAGENVGLLFAKLDSGAIKSGDVISDAAASGFSAAPADSAGDPRFAQVEAHRAHLLEMRKTGLTTTDQIDETLRGMMFELGGRHWVMNAVSERWHSSDGGEWKLDTPPT